MKKVSIVIPTFNERENILALIPVIKKETEALKEWEFEIVVVDDDSPDGTGEIARKRFKSDRSVKVYTRKKERGLATAIKFGIEKSTGRIIIGMDADFNHDPKCIPSLLSLLKDSKLVIASRFIRGGGMQNRKRYYATRLFNIMLRILFGFPTTDNASGYYAIRTKDLRKLGLDKVYYGYGDYHLRMVYRAKLNGYGIKETPVYYQERPYGESKSRLFRMAYGYLKEAIRLRVCAGKTP